MATARLHSHRPKATRGGRLVAGLLLSALLGTVSGFGSTSGIHIHAQSSTTPAIELLLQAEQEINVGRYEEASRCLAQLAAIQDTLNPADRARFDSLCQTPRITVVRGAAAAAPTPADQARQKLKQARLELADYNPEGAEKLAREVESLKVILKATDDSPKKVLEETARLRTDGRMLLNGARHWLGRKDYGRAEKLALAAEKVGTGWSLNPFADTPTKVLKEIESARARGTQNPIQQVSAKSSGSPVKEIQPAVNVEASMKPADPKSEEARKLINLGRKALQARDLKAAREHGEKARALRANLAWWEDTPEKLLADVAKSGPGNTTPATATAANKAPIQNKEQAVARLKQGRTLLAENKLEEALEIATRLKAQKAIKWGLFEDSPESLFQAVETARVQRDQQMAGRILAEARQYYAKGDLDKAAQAAERAQQLHGPYSVFDFGDRPTKLLAEIDTARQKDRTGGGMRIVKQTPENNPPQTPVPALDPASQARKLMLEARAALQKGDSSKAYQMADQARALKTRHNLKLDDSPEVIIAEAKKAAGVDQTGTRTVTAPTGPANDPAAAKKQQAAALVSSARVLQNQGKLVEARQKAEEALRVGASFAPTEDSPETALQQINARAAQVVTGLVRSAHEAMATAPGNPVEAATKAEGILTNARNLSAAFGFDTQAVDAQLHAVRGLKNAVSVTVSNRPPTPPTTPTTPTAGPAPLPVPTVPSPVMPVVQTTPGIPTPGPTVQTPPAPGNPGQMLLDSARVELRKGELASAHKAALEACDNKYGVQEEAQKILRTIEAEQGRQRGLAANRSFDAANQAFQRGDFQYATNLIAAIDATQLDVGRKGRLREIMMTPQMQPSQQIVRSNPTGTEGTQKSPGAGQAANSIPTTGQGGVTPVRHDQDTTPGRVTVSDTAAPKPLGILETAAAMKEIKFQAKRDEGLKVQSEATDKFRNGQTDAALELLQLYLETLNDAGLETNQTSLLRRPCESRLQQFRILKQQQELLSRSQTVKESAHAAIGRQQLAEQHKNKKVEDLMKQFNSYLKEGKYLEAERCATQAHELDPDNAIVSAGMYIAKRQRRVDEYKEIKEGKEAFVWEGLNDAERQGDPRAIREMMVFDKERSAIAQKRKGNGVTKLTTKSLKEREIENKLNTPVTLNFKDVPLYAVIDDIRAYHGINIWMDKQALDTAGISPDRPVDLKLEGVSLRSALNLLLKNLHLTYVVRDEVLQITTEAEAKGKLETRIINVTDLIIKVPNFGELITNQPPPPLRENGNPPLPSGNAPVAMPFSLMGGQSVGTPGGTGGPGGTLETNGQVRRSSNATEEESLIRLIQHTIAPRSWESMGGPGTISFHPVTSGLVINQTTDIQEQIADLLQALRRLQDQEVAVEVRFIAITEDFYERMGVNFQMNIVNKEGQKLAPQLLQGVGNPNATQFNTFAPNNFIAGITPAGSFTPALNIPISNSGFFQAIPSFGGYSGGLGGIGMGLAFLSDIQVFLFLEAVQGDVRNNIMQAPKLTLFNGQTATLTVTEQRSYITSAGVQQVGNQVAFVPQTTNFNLNTNLTIQAVISADRRFVRMSINPQLTNQVPGPVAQFPIVIPLFNQAGAGVFASPTDPILLTQFIQQPNFTSVNVGTTVMVPDGGTVLMGGLKRLSEGRSEYGPPILSKLPAINRLFRNVGYGREASSLLIMVTPRIIIQEEEEERQTGYRDVPLIGTGN